MVKVQNLLIGALISIIHSCVNKASLSPVLESGFLESLLLHVSSGEDLVRLKEILKDLRTAGMLHQELELHC